MNCPGRKRAIRGCKQIRHADPAGERFGWMAGQPVRDLRAKAVLRENVPNRFTAPRGAGGRLKASPVRARFDKSADAMLMRTFSGGDGRPKHRRDHGLHRGEIAHHSAFDHSREGGKFPSIKKRLDHAPICGVPTNQKHPASHVRYSRFLRQSVSPAAPAARHPKARVLGSGTAAVVMAAPVFS